MHIKCFRVQNFRRLKNAFVQMDQKRTIFVGANNSGKTSATQLFQMFLGPRVPMQIYDFTADSWERFRTFDPSAGHTAADLPQIVFDLWFDVDDDNVHRVLDILPSLDWAGQPVGVRMIYAPIDDARLVANYTDARAKAQGEIGENDSAYKPWPQTMLDYLTRRLTDEYEIKYFVLDATQCGRDLQPNAGYQPAAMSTQGSSPAKVIDAIVRVDCLNAQRHLSDADTRGGRSEDLSKRMSRFYQRNLQQLDSDLHAMAAIAESEDKLNAHFADVFEPTLKQLSELGYPGITNPSLVLKARFDAHSMLNSSAKIHYTLPAQPGAPVIEQTLPDQYNGLGFKNLIYMVVELLDFHQSWVDAETDRPPVHLVMIEEPEVHLHAQVQQVFIKKILSILPEPEPDFRTQLLVTTHSPHIIYESTFTPIRYFCRSSSPGGLHLTDVKDLSTFYEDEEVATREFLQQYIKLTHCDLFFADAAVLVEGNVERLLLPSIIDRFVPALQARHLTILEVGGAFAHRFETLVAFLGLPTLVITDLDSVEPPVSTPNANGDKTGPDAGSSPPARDQQEVQAADPASTHGDIDGEEDDDAGGRKACMVDTPDAVTSNPTLRQWLPKMTAIADLLSANDIDKSSVAADGSPGPIRVAYQTQEAVIWQGQTDHRVGRTLEEAFALQNLDWTQSHAGKALGLKIAKAANMSITELHGKLFDRVKNFDKTRFALGVIAELNPTWVAPAYIVEGLQWLETKLDVIAAEEPSDYAGLGAVAQ